MMGTSELRKELVKDTFNRLATCGGFDGQFLGSSDGEDAQGCAAHAPTSTEEAVRGVVNLFEGRRWSGMRRRLHLLRHRRSRQCGESFFSTPWREQPLTALCPTDESAGKRRRRATASQAMIANPKSLLDFCVHFDVFFSHFPSCYGVTWCVRSFGQSRATPASPSREPSFFLFLFRGLAVRVCDWFCGRRWKVNDRSFCPRVLREWDQEASRARTDLIPNLGSGAFRLPCVGQPAPPSPSSRAPCCASTR